MMALADLPSSMPSRVDLRARLDDASARMKARGSCKPLMGKFSTRAGSARPVASSGPERGPKGIGSMRVVISTPQSFQPHGTRNENPKAESEILNKFKTTNPNDHTSAFPMVFEFLHPSVFEFVFGLRVSDFEFGRSSSSVSPWFKSIFLPPCPHKPPQRVVILSTTRSFIGRMPWCRDLDVFRHTPCALGEWLQRRGSASLSAVPSGRGVERVHLQRGDVDHETGRRICPSSCVAQDRGTFWQRSTR